MKTSAGEMPFLDHLEELRSRIMWSVGALVVGVGISLWAVRAFNVIDYIAAPALPYIPGHKLTTMSLLEIWAIWIKLSLISGIVLASPVLIYQLWGFLSPALMPREKKAIIPTLMIGLGLFILGAWVSWTWLVPFSVEVLSKFDSQHVAQIVTFDSYMDLVMVLVLAIGIMTELPLVMTMLSWLGVVKSAVYRRGRRIAIVVNLVLGAIISPGAEVISMMFVTVPLLALYEVGVLASWLVEKRALKAAARRAAVAGALLLLAMGSVPRNLRALNPPQIGRVTAQDTSRRTPVRTTAQDSAKNKRLGIPTGKSYPDPGLDSTAQALQARAGYTITRYFGDSAFIQAGDQKMRMLGHASVTIDDQTIEGSKLSYDSRNCLLLSEGETRIFATGRNPAISQNLITDTCKKRTLLADASTRSPTETGGSDWFMRGNLAVDSTFSRYYIAHAEFTTCDREIADYHFGASEVKYIAKSLMVARGVVLYVRDVPVLPLPFMFQDTKRGRRSGILIPKFGFNDIVRPTRGYNRQVTEFGYYWATSDYMDVTTRIDWYANRYVRIGSDVVYDVKDRFLSGGISYYRSFQSEGGGGASELRWNHDQRFDDATRLNLNISLNSNTAVTQRNSVDPYQSTQQISSGLNFSKNTRRGQISIGGNRSQELSNGSGSMTFPSININPNPIGFAGGRVVWSPALSATNTTQFKSPLAPQLVIGSGVLDTLLNTGSARTTTLNLGTPFTIGRFSLPLTFTATDQTSAARTVVTRRIEDPQSPGDSVTMSTISNGSFLSSMNWHTSLNLPVLFEKDFPIAPSVGIANIAFNEPYALRVPGTNGKWVHQAKRLEFGLGARPTIYGFFNKPIGPALRLRYTFAPTFAMQYSPTATLSEEFANAVTAHRGVLVPRETPARKQLTFGLSQTVMAKLRAAKTDTLATDASLKRISLLSINTSSMAYDFEQAKLPGRTGWITQSISNQVQSDLVRGFGLSFSHDLWQGMVGSDTAVFKPFLTNVSASFSLTGGTFRSIAALFGLASAPSSTGSYPAYAPSPAPIGGQGYRPAFGMGGQTGFSANVSYSLTRTRPNAPPVVEIDPNTGLPTTPIFNPQTPNQTNISLNTSFSPTQNWQVRWQTMYNVSAGRFESQSLQLNRDLHDWRATFNFQKSPNGNFTLNFSIALINFEKDIKFDYNQTTIKQSVP